MGDPFTCSIFPKDGVWGDFPKSFVWLIKTARSQSQGEDKGSGFLGTREEEEDRRQRKGLLLKGGERCAECRPGRS